MRGRRLYHRADGNQAALVDELRKRGVRIEIIGRPVDLLVGWRGQTYLADVKATEKSPFTKGQVEFFANWPKYGGPLYRWVTLQDALRDLGIVE
jgi:hypothetical protein